MRERILKLLADETIDILANADLLKELENVLSRPKFSNIAESEHIEAFLDILENRLTIIQTDIEIKMCRDPKDDFLLSICYTGQADYLLTGDNDLLSLISFEQTRMITLSDFEKLHFPTE